MEVAAIHSDSLEGSRRRIPVRRDFPLGCGRKITSTRNLPRKGISPKRNFPPGCGRKASLVMEMNPAPRTVRDDTKQVTEKVLDEDPSSTGLKENICVEADKVEVENESNVEEEDQFQVRTASGGNLELEDPQQTGVSLDSESSLNQPQSKSQSAIINIDGNIGSLKGKLGKESVVHCKRDFPGESGDENDSIGKCHRDQSICLTSCCDKVPQHPPRAALNFLSICGEHSPKFKLGSSSSRENVKKHEPMVKKTALASSDNRVIVQALMAALNCPWRQGRKIQHHQTRN